MEKVDVVLNVYGKPYQTAVTLLSLLRHSGHLIDKIYIIEEPNQPKDTNFDFIYDLLKNKIVKHTPKHWLWINQIDKTRLKDTDYRLSIRYQYGWEKSDKIFLFITHNDVLYKDNIIQILSDNLKDNIGIGRVGQCGNCPAAAANLCNRYNYWDYRPEKEELEELAKKYNARRAEKYGPILERNKAWPLPECRLNEWVALVNLKIAREITMPYGDAMPFGAYNELDLGTQWFYDITHKGYKVQHYDFTKIAVHAWANEVPNGHSALFDKNMYKNSEAIAKDVLIKDFGLNSKDITTGSIFSKILTPFKR